MKNEFYLLILFLSLCLTSCKRDHDTSLTGVLSVTDEMSMEGSTEQSRSFSLPSPKVADSSNYYFFVENKAGTIDFQRYDFSRHVWQPVTSLFQQSFLGGPLHTGRIIHQQALWRDSFQYLLLGKEIERGMVVKIQPLAEIRINNDPAQSVYLVVPEDSEYRLSGCNNFDDWFTYCNQQRFYVQYWIEHQFKPRFIKRIQWKPYTIDN